MKGSRNLKIFGHLKKRKEKQINESQVYETTYL